jgi:hypothetical protein
MIADRPLPMTVPIKPRETAFSYMSRLAARNELSAVDLGRYTGVTFQKVLRGDPETMTMLASRGGIDCHELRAWSPKPIEGPMHSFAGHAFPSKTILYPKMRGCPVCLREDADQSDLPANQAMTIKGDWLIPHVMICLKHEHPLVELWYESAPTARYDTALQLRRLAPGIIKGDLDDELREPTDFDMWIDDRISGIQGDTWLDQYGLHAASTFCRLLGHALLRHEMSAPSSAHQDSRWALYQMGFDVAQHGMKAIREALQGLQDLPCSPQQGPKAIFPLLYDRLAHDHRGDPAYEPFCAILRKHLLETWPLGVGDELMGEPVTERRLHSLQSAARETGVDPRRLRTMLISAGLLDDSKSDAWATFDARAAADILTHLTELLPAKTFCETFCMSRSQFNLLVAERVLVPAIASTKTKNIWSPRDGQTFLNGLLQGAEQLRQAQHGWEHISKSAQRLKLHPKAIIDAIKDGRINRVGNHSDFDGYAAVYVYHDEVASVLNSEDAPAMSIEVFGKAVGANHLPGLRRLVMNGHTSATSMRNPKTNAVQHYFSAQDATAFHTRFFTLRTLSKHSGMSWQRAGAFLKEAGVMPYSPDGVDYGNLFLRDEVELALSR